MKEYVLNGKVIVATEKAYNVLYKEMGYLPKESVEEVVANVQSEETEKEIKTKKKKVVELEVETVEKELEKDSEESEETEKESE